MQQKKHTWTLLRCLAGLSFTHWLCFSDFNEILHPYEKSGGNDRNPNLMNDFREALRDCNLMDVGYKGYPFTQGNERFGPDFVEGRLDRFLCNNVWSERFVDCATTNLESWTFDHSPLLMEVQDRGNGLRYQRNRTSRIYYEDMWSSYDTCKGIIEEEWRKHGRWNRDNPIHLFQKVTKDSMASLLLWSKKEFKGR